jgi:signal peptidase I
MKSKSSKKPAEKETKTASSRDSMRETVESVVIAFVLAFLFRTFEAEAFVIPTGSMAPTLMGQHKDFDCPECGFRFQVGVGENGSRLDGCTCPNCRYRIRFNGQRDGEEPRTYKGDRIVVSKFPYEVGEPKRWDVAVFKYPATAKVNYIKRLVGLPNETLRIQYGDIFTKHDGANDFHIERKSPEKVEALLQTVYDNDFSPTRDDIAKKGFRRWNPDVPGMWKPSGDDREFAIGGEVKGEQWLRYWHLFPSRDQWERLIAGEPVAQPGVEWRQAEAHPVTDFYGYNSSNDGRYGANWVRDLALECDLELQALAPQGDKPPHITLELVAGGRRFQCRFEFQDGKAAAKLIVPDSKSPPAEPVKIRAPGKAHVRFANVDQQLILWVDGSLVRFQGTDGKPADTFAYDLPPIAEATLADRSPAAIGAEGVGLTVSHLKVLRDIFYIAMPSGYDGHDEWGKIEFELGPDEFLMLGDNSPSSKDSRLWESHDPNDPLRKEYFVRRELLIGKAMFVYWPHAWAPDWAWKVDAGFMGPIYLPFYPDFSRMRLVH